MLVYLLKEDWCARSILKLDLNERRKYKKTNKKGEPRTLTWSTLIICTRMSLAVVQHSSLEMFASDQIYHHHHHGPPSRIYVNAWAFEHQSTIKQQLLWWISNIRIISSIFYSHSFALVFSLWCFFARKSSWTMLIL